MYVLVLKNEPLMRTRKALVTRLPPEPAPPSLCGSPAVPRLLLSGQSGSPAQGAVGHLAWCLSPGTGVGTATTPARGPACLGKGGRRQAP